MGAVLVIAALAAAIYISQSPRDADAGPPLPSSDDPTDDALESLASISLKTALLAIGIGYAVKMYSDARLEEYVNYRAERETRDVVIAYLETGAYDDLIRVGGSPEDAYYLIRADATAAGDTPYYGWRYVSGVRTYIAARIGDVIAAHGRLPVDVVVFGPESGPPVGLAI